MKLIADHQTLSSHAADASLFEIMPQAVAYPKNVDEIKELVRTTTTSLTVRAAGTDMTGGPLNTGTIIDVAHLDHIKEIGPDPDDSIGAGFAVTEPGVLYRDFEKETLKYGLLLPCYPASRELCAMGGIVANNSGGEKTLTYGQTKDYVLEVKAVLRDGNEYAFRELTRAEVSRKMLQHNLEGEIYGRMFDLITRNDALIKAAKPKVSKNSSGYLLWEVWNRDRQTFNLAKLFCGSQGTLGIITEAKLKLIRPKEHSTLLVIFLKDIRQLADVVGTVLTHQPESFESYDDHTMKIALRYLPDFLKLMGVKHLLSLAWQFLPEIGMALTGGVPRLILEAEFTGDSEKEIYAKARAAQRDLAPFGMKTRIAANDQEEKKYWAVRRESFNLLRHHVRGRRTAPFIDDIIVRPERLPEFLPRLNEIMDHYDLTYTIAGHIGDGNFHIIPLMDMTNPKSRLVIPELATKVYELVFEFGGSMSGEHNDGLIRSPFLKQMFGDRVYALFEETKRIFDPGNIFNPGKKIGAKLSYAMEHLKV